MTAPALLGMGVLLTVLWVALERKRAQLVRSQEAILRALTSACVGLVVVDHEGRYRFVNRAYRDMLGLGDKARPGAAVREVLADIYEEQIKPRLSRALAGETVHYILQRGNRRYTVAVEPHRDPQGRPCAIVVIMDATQELEALEHSRYLASLVEATHDAVFSLNIDANIVSWNRGAEKMFGYRAAEAIGQKPSFMYPPERSHELNSILPELRAGRVVRRETVRQRADGSRVEITHTVSPIFDPSGLLIGAVSVSHDITRLRAAQADRDRLALIVEHTGDFVAMSGLDLTPLYINPAARRLVGLEGPAEVRDFFFPEDWEFLEQTFYPQVRESGRGAVELRFRHFQTGEPLWMNYQLFLVRDASGQAIGYATVSQDIRDHKRLERELEEKVERRTAELNATNRELEAFTYSVSHDLRTPLRVLDGYTQWLLEEHAEPLGDEARRYLGYLRDGTEQMRHLIDDLLRLSQVGRQPLRRDPIDVEGLVTRAWEALPTRAGPARLTRGPLPRCHGDDGLLAQVWTNLLSNALKYTRLREFPQIEVGFRVGAYFVRDNGAGFDMRYAGKLFGVFQRLHRADEFEGTGVGLAIVQRIVHRHGGEVWAEATPQEGATFYFTLAQ